MKASVRKVMNDTRCQDSLDDLLCSIKKVSRPELVHNESHYPSRKKRNEEMFGNSLQFLSNMTVSKMIIDLVTFGIFTQHIYK
jgi:hypothetical protein